MSMYALRQDKRQQTAIVCQGNMSKGGGYVNAKSPGRMRNRGDWLRKP